MVHFIEYASLPATAPGNHPRVIDIATYDNAQEDQGYEMTIKSAFNVWDAVVTLLHTISPSTLDSFLSGSTHEFKVLLSWTSEPNRFLIWRKGTEILAGEYQDYPSFAGGVYEWDNVVRCNVSATGSWNVSYASFGLYTRRDSSAVWNGNFTRDPLPMRGAVFTDAVNRDHIQVAIARMLMSECPWPANKFTCTVTST